MQEGEPTADHTVVWLKRGDDMMPRPVKTGMSDGAYKIIEQGVQAGDSVVLSAQFVTKEKEVKKGENPFMPGPPGRNRNSNQQQKK
jgi:HlyD family secretion protein